jgi:hypothetical protein
VELHKLRKTGASRRCLAGVPLKTLMLELGHESLATTQRYLADVRKPGEAIVAHLFVSKNCKLHPGHDADEMRPTHRGTPSYVFASPHSAGSSPSHAS